MIKKTINGAELATKYVRPSSKVITLAMGCCLLSSLTDGSFGGSTNTDLGDEDDDDPYFG